MPLYISAHERYTDAYGREVHAHHGEHPQRAERRRLENYLSKCSLLLVFAHSVCDVHECGATCRANDKKDALDQPLALFAQRSSALTHSI